MIDDERDLFEKFTKEIQTEFEKYYRPAIQRKEIAQAPYPEKNGNYLYFSRYSRHFENDYEVIYRRSIGNVMRFIFLLIARRANRNSFLI